MEPVIMALMPARWQISRPSSLVRRSLGGRPIYCRVCWILDSGTMLRNGDCCSCEASACLSVPSNTGSPVVFTNSVSRMESFSVRALVRRVKKRPTAAAAISTAATGAHIHFLVRAGDTLVADEEALTVLADGAAEI